jgi:uncharacterized membrane protein
MGKTDFLDALKRAMPGLPPATQAKTLAFYEQRFVDGAALGRSEDVVARELGDPSRIAMTLRASVFEATITAPARRPAGALRMLLTALGLGIVNLFMVAPAAVVGGLLICLHAAALSFYVGGIAITASGLAGANELVLRAPLRAFGVMDASRTRVIISDRGIEVMDDKADDDADEATPRSTPRVVRGAEAMAGRGLRITTHLDDASRSTQTVFGFSMVLGGIALFLLGVVAGRYTLRGVKRYAQMNLSLLRGS